MTKTSSFRNRLKKNSKSGVTKVTDFEPTLVPRLEQEDEPIIPPDSEIKAVDILIAEPSVGEAKRPELFLLAKSSQSFNKPLNTGAKQANMLSPKGMSKTERIKQNRVWSSRKDS